MSDPKEQQGKPDELELEPERIADLEPSDEDAEQIRGGPAGWGVSVNAGCPPQP